MPTLVEDLSALVALPSVSSTIPELDMSNHDVIAYLANRCEDVGCQVEIDTVNESDRKYNLVAKLGSGQGGMILAGHTDTVPYDLEGWDTDPFSLTLKKNRLFGLGSADMKGFFAASLAAMAALDCNKLEQPVYLVATADEETSMEGARALMQKRGGFAKQAIVGEPTCLKPVYMHKGIMMESLKVIGRSGHSSDPAYGLNALEGLHLAMALLMQLRQDFSKKYSRKEFVVSQPTLNFGHAHGGDNPNRICGEVELHYDLRPTPGMKIGEIRDLIRTTLTEQLKPMGYQLQFEALVAGVNALHTPRESHLIGLAEKVSGHPAETVAYATEGPFYQEHGMDVVVMGPGSIQQAHQINEFVEVSQLQHAQRILQQTFTHL